MSEPKLQGKTQDIPKHLVWDAWLKVKRNGGAAGADGVTIEQFEQRLKDNLYRLWNRMTSGSYFPGPVRAVEIPKKGGTRILGIPNVVDRVAQSVACRRTAETARRRTGSCPLAHMRSAHRRPGGAATAAGRRVPAEAGGARRPLARSDPGGRGAPETGRDGLHRLRADHPPGRGRLEGRLAGRPSAGAPAVGARAGHVGPVRLRRRAPGGRHGDGAVLLLAGLVPLSGGAAAAGQDPAQRARRG